jgi:hypothetical protein
MAGETYGWPDAEVVAIKPLTQSEVKQHQQAVFTLFGGGILAYVVFAYLVGAPPLRYAVAKTWSGVHALMQLLW